MKVSVIIPARNEKYLVATVADIYRHFRGNFEVIVMLDGHTEFKVPSESDYPNLSVRQLPESGIRPLLNQAVENSDGDYILKLDAHCSFCDDFDRILLDRYEDDWVMVARRYTLSLEEWKRYPRAVDYYYLSCPWTYYRAFMMQSCPWITQTEKRIPASVDDLMCFQGSMWLMSRKHWEWLGGLETGKEVYAEHHEISMKTWLGGRRVVINKNAWYAHPAKSERGYRMSMRQVWRDHTHSARRWTENQWEGRLHDFDWLIDKFWPLPTEHNKHKTEKYYWPEDWRERFYDRAVPAG